MDDCKCFSCPLSDCVSPCPFGVDIDDDIDIDDYVFDTRKKYIDYYRAYYH